ncbi:NAD(P)-dependent oxidoreductase [Aquibaculum arenosum]|uniref:NAD(P)-dependent oxidoreductase n=1 Tax=Aquibaculum arenosum TaxID=3032591 RepID=A0ABT5YP42_9PROT|nr:NAD(P)-dependent oxidoreductase [Fodinicurvata sp. CAU 1616]MDF2096652.1 NAD(P)-dependent oxidoreductase [Fodinicurvata sp. CAU 1616]
MDKARAPGVRAGRLSGEEIARNFTDLHPPLDAHEALVEADRCYFCYDAPCVKACPTEIDIPLFIRQIQTADVVGAGETILQQNIMGGACARVCPTETLCEEACVRNLAEDKPVAIGLLQRHATDRLMEEDRQVFERAAPTGRRIAVVGAGPAGLACAHRLAVHGHEVTVFEARPKSGGLNEYGIAAYKLPDNFAQREVEYILEIGGIEVRHGQRLGHEITLEQLRKDYDGVFLGMGLGSTNSLGVAGESLEGVHDAVDTIAELRQSPDLTGFPIGRRVVVIGGGMTAIDIAVQARRLGADEVTLVYRRGREQMKASRYEQELAQTNGVRIVTWAVPTEVLGDGGRATAVRFDHVVAEDGRLVSTGESFEVAADQVFKAIGQTFVAAGLGEAGLKLDGGRIAVGAGRCTSLPDVWAGGDCIAGGQDLTVAAVEDGKQAAESIHRTLGAAAAA